MKSNKNKDRIGIVFSTDENFSYNANEDDVEELPKNAQKLRVSLDRKNRGGKEVTLITGFVCKEETLDALCKLLKTKCGVGGSAKDQQIIVQGNHRDKVVEILIKEGYTQTKKSGG